MDSSEFIDYILYVLQKGLNESNKPSSNKQVINYVHPEQLKKELSFALGSPTPLDEMMGLCQQILYYSTNTQAKFFCNDLYGGGDLYGTLGDFITSYLNTSGVTYETSPIFTLMEKEIIEKSFNLYGFTDKNAPNRDGIMVPGGSISNLYAFHLARTKLNPKLNGAGMYITTPMKVFCSDQAHYSLKKSMMLSGLGSYHLITIPTDKNGKMIIEKLEQAVKNHSPHPLMVVAMAGTTVLGAFDPIHEISKVAKKHNMWLHVDASWGGPVIFTDNHKKLLKGISEADSMTWNPHKMLKVPLQCSIFMTKHGETLKKAFKSGAEYLFQNDKCYPVKYDMGEQTFLCSRRIDSLKFWLPWKVYGDAGYRRHVERNIANAKFFTDLVKNHPKFKLAHDHPEYANVCFWYLPQQNLTYGQLHELAPKIKERLLNKGKLMINYQPMGDLPNFFRMVFHDSRLTQSDLREILTMIEEEGSEIYLDIYSKRVDSTEAEPEIPKLEKATLREETPPLREKTPEPVLLPLPKPTPKLEHLWPLGEDHPVLDLTVPVDLKFKPMERLKEDLVDDPPVRPRRKWGI